mgnify:CR=1
MKPNHVINRLALALSEKIEEETSVTFTIQAGCFTGNCLFNSAPSMRYNGYQPQILCYIPYTQKSTDQH